MANRNEENMERKAIAIIRDWAIPTAAVLITATGAWVRIEHMAAQTEGELRELREELRAGRSAAGSGVLDTTTHGAMDNHIRHFFEEELGKSGFRRLLSEFSERLGPLMPVND